MTQNTLHYRKVINGVGYRFALPILAPPPAAGHLVDIKVAVFTEEVQKQLYAPSLKSAQTIRRPKEEDEDHVTLDVWLAGAIWFLPILNVAAEDNGKVYLVKARMMPAEQAKPAAPPRSRGSVTVKLPKAEVAAPQPPIAAEVSSASNGISITISGQLFAPAAKATTTTSAAAAPVKSKVEPAPKPEPAPKSEPAAKPAAGFGFGLGTGQAHRPATFTLPDPSPAEGIVSCPMSRGPPGCEAADPTVLGIRPWNEICFEEARLLCYLGTQVVAADKFPPTADTPSFEEDRLGSCLESRGNWAQLSWDESSTDAPAEETAGVAPKERVGAARIAL